MEIPVIEPLFTKVAEDIPGAEGPVFDKKGDFYIVAPEVEVDGKPAGEILQVDLKTGKVKSFFFFFFLFPYFILLWLLTGRHKLIITFSLIRLWLFSVILLPVKVWNTSSLPLLLVNYLY